MANFVLVSGAWHAAWCWERVVPLLEGRKHKATAPNLLGMGPDRTPLAEVTLARWADQVAELIRAEPEPVILVGHSRGGIVISEAAERVPDRIQRLVYLAAYLIPRGASIASASGADRWKAAASFVELRPDKTGVVPPDQVGPIFYNTTPHEWVERAVGQLTAEPMDVLATRLRLSAEGFGRVPRAYIECTQDRALPLELQRGFHARMPCNPVVTLETDHSPFYSAPEKLVDALEAIARAG